MSIFLLGDIGDIAIFATFASAFFYTLHPTPYTLPVSDKLIIRWMFLSPYRALRLIIAWSLPGHHLVITWLLPVVKYLFASFFVPRQ